MKTEEFSLESLLQSLTPEQREKLTEEVTKVVRSNMYPFTPIKLELMITERCNFACDYCFLGNHGKQRDMPVEIAEKAIDFLFEHAPAPTPEKEQVDVTIVLFGGEPLLNLELVKHVVEYAQAKRKPGQILHFDCTTNGTQITDEIAEFCGKAPIPLLISLDGYQISHDRHRKFRDGRPTFDLIMSNLQILRKYQGWIGARVTYTPETVTTLADGIIWLNQHGIAQFVIGAAMTGEAWSPTALAEIDTQYYKLADYYRKTRFEGWIPLRIVQFETSNEETEKKLKHVWGCSAGRTSMSVSADGAIYGCSRFATLNNCEGAYLLGNVTEGILRYDYLRDLQENRSITRNKCHGCELAQQCAGTCPAVSLEASDNIYATDELSCYLHKLATRMHNEQPDLSKIHIDYPNFHARRAMAKPPEELTAHIQPL